MKLSDAPLATAAGDALEWLKIAERLGFCEVIGKRIGIQAPVIAENRERLLACIAALEATLGEENDGDQTHRRMFPEGRR